MMKTNLATSRRSEEVVPAPVNSLRLVTHLGSTGLPLSSPLGAGAEPYPLMSRVPRGSRAHKKTIRGTRPVRRWDVEPDVPGWPSGSMRPGDLTSPRRFDTTGAGRDSRCGVERATCCGAERAGRVVEIRLKRFPVKHPMGSLVSKVRNNRDGRLFAVSGVNMTKYTYALQS